MKRVLIIEDDPFVMELLDNILAKKGFEVLQAINKKGAIAKINKERLDLIVTDIMLPYVGGFDIIDHIKTLPGKEKVPIIMLTGMDEVILDATENHADACLTKPFKSKQLLKIIDELLES